MQNISKENNGASIAAKNQKREENLQSHL